ncbi:MAG: protein kinase [Actinomycetes bacterium]
MSPSRSPLDPPSLDGYVFIDRLGAGGFADVFLYEREFPRQRVAIKVLDRVIGGDGGQARFVAEANAMASLSTHPYIVTIFHAATASGGNPFLVMEYYPGSNFAERSMTERFSVAQVLRLGIQVASAVETAHQAGILHRDIKPANLLTSAYGRPGLTDFGIALSRDTAQAAAEGLSIPWSPPEALSGPDATDERSDVYSLAATLYTLLERRSPFEEPGGSNRSIDLIARIERSPLAPFSREDVPGSLFRLLSQAMAKNPGSRPASAADFARSLQAIESELHFDATPFEVVGEGPSSPGSKAIDVDAGSTNIKGPMVVDSQTRFARSSRPSSHDTVVPRDRGAQAVPIRGVPFAVPDVPRVAPAAQPVGPAEGSSRLPSSASYDAPQPTSTYKAPLGESSRRPPPRKWLVAAGALLLALLAAAFFVFGSSSGEPTISVWWSNPTLESTNWTLHWSPASALPAGTFCRVSLDPQSPTEHRVRYSVPCAKGRYRWPNSFTVTGTQRVPQNADVFEFVTPGGAMATPTVSPTPR